MEKNENKNQGTLENGSNAHVGYGRNKGDGSDSENIQRTDSKGRYAKTSDSFLDDLFKKGIPISYIGRGGLVHNMGYVEYEEQEFYMPKVREQFKILFDTAPEQFMEAMLSLPNVVSFRVSENGNDLYHDDTLTVMVSWDELKNGGDIYESAAQIVMHEYLHAIDGVLAVMLGNSFHDTASFLVKLSASGGKTFLQQARQELGPFMDELVTMARDDPNRQNGDFRSMLKYSKRFGAMGDMVGACQTSGKNNDLAFQMGLLGHEGNYFDDPVNCAAEVFAEMGETLAFNGEMADVLKRVAPKTVACYYELLGLARDKFREMGKGWWPPLGEIHF